MALQGLQAGRLARLPLQWLLDPIPCLKSHFNPSKTGRKTAENDLKQAPKRAAQGHGSQYQGDKKTMPADVICPLDCIGEAWPASVIVDTEIHQKLYDPLPPLVFDLFRAVSSLKTSNKRRPSRGSQLLLICF